MMEEYQGQIDSIMDRLFDKKGMEVSGASSKSGNSSEADKLELGMSMLRGTKP